MPLNIANEIDPITGLPVESNVDELIPNDTKKSLNIIDEFGADIQSRPDFGEYKRDIQSNILDEKLNLGALDEFRAESQTGTELTGKFLGNMATEAILGSVEGLGYALDFEDLFNTNDLANRDFDNWFSKTIRETKEGIQSDLFGIYQSEVAERGKFDLDGKLSDPTWWASQGKTAGVTLGMMGSAFLPAGLAAAGLKGLGAGATAVRAGSTLVGGLTSAKVEGTMEASQKFQEDYDKWIANPELQEAVAEQYSLQIEAIDSQIQKAQTILNNPADEGYQVAETEKRELIIGLEGQRNSARKAYEEDLDRQARERAGMAASKVYKANAIKAPLEVAQFALLTKPFAGLRKGVEAAKATKFSKVARFGAQPVSEAGEEIYQGFASQEASRSIETGEDFGAEGVGERLGEYITSEEGKEAAFLGGLMGLVFDVGGIAYKKGIEAVQKNVDIKKSHANDPVEIQKAYSNIGLMNEFVAENALGNEPVVKKAEKYTSVLDAELEKEDIIPERTEEIERQKAHIAKVTEEIQKQDAELAKNPLYENPILRNNFIQTKLSKQIYKEEYDKMSALVEEELSNSGLEGNEIEYYKLKTQSKELNAAKKELISENSLKGEEKASLLSYINKKTTKLNEEVKALEKTLKEENPDFKAKRVNPTNADVLKKYIREQQKHDAFKNSVIEDRMEYFSNLTPAQSTIESENIAIQEDKDLVSHYSGRIEKAETEQELTEIETALINEYPEQYEKLKKDLDGRKAVKKAEVEKIRIKDKQELNKSIDEKVIEETIEPTDTNIGKKVTYTRGGKEITGEIIRTSPAGNYVIKSEGRKSADSIKPDQVEFVSDNETIVADFKEKIEANRRNPAELSKLHTELKDLNLSDESFYEIEDELSKAELAVLNEAPDESFFKGEVTHSEEILANEPDPVESTTMPDVNEEALEVEEEFDGSDKIRLFETVPNVLLTTMAKVKKVFKIDGVEHIEDAYGPNGKVMLTENYNAAIANADNYKAGSDVILSVNKDFIKDGKVIDSNGKVKGNLTAKNIPISIQSKEDMSSGSSKFMSIRDLSNKTWDSMEENQREKTLELREKMFAAYNKNPDVQFQTKVISKDGGWTNKSKTYALPKENLWINDQKQYGEIYISTADANGRIPTRDGGYAINTKGLAGAPYIVYENANGEPVASLMKYSEIKNNDNGQEYIDTVFQLISQHMQGTGEFENIDINKEVSKYLYLRKTLDKDLKTKTNSKSTKTDPLMNNLFSLTRINDNFELHLPHITGSKRYNIKRTEDGLKVSHYSNGKEVALRGGMDTLYKHFNERLVEMYPNVVQDLGRNPNEFNRFAIDENGALVETENQNYFDFLSEMDAVKTRVHPVLDSNGEAHYVTQPNLIIDNNIISIEEATVVEEKPKQVPEAVIEEIAEQEVPIKKDASVSKPGRKRKIKSVAKDIDPTQIDTSGDELLSVSKDDLNYNSATLSSFSKMDSIQEEADIMSSMLMWMLEEFDEARANGEEVNLSDTLSEIKEIVNDNIEHYSEYATDKTTSAENVSNGAFGNYKANQVVVAYLTTVRDNFEQEVDSDGNIVFIGYRQKLNDMYKALSFNAIHEVVEDADANGQNEKTSYIDGFNYKTDPEKSMSAQIKRLLYNIPVLLPNGKIKPNKIGQASTVDPSKVFNYLMENLSNLEMDEMMAELTDLAEINNIAKGVLSKVSEAQTKNTDVFNKFISVMKKQQAKFVMLKFDKKVKKNKDGSIKSSTNKVSVIEANRTGTKDVIFDKWSSAHKVDAVKNGILENIDGELVVNKKAASTLLNSFISATNRLNSSVEFDEVLSLFKEIGIEVSNEAMAKLRKDWSNGKNKKYFKAMFGSSTNEKKFGDFIYDYYGHIFNNLVAGKKIFESQTGAIKTLAIYQQKFDVDAFNQSFRNANGDMIYSFVNPHYLSNIVDRLNNDKDSMTEFLEDPFASQSTWLKSDEKVELVYFDASKGNDGQSKEYQDQNDTEKETTKVNLFVNNNNKKFSYMFTPSPSDKTTFSLLRVPRMIFDYTRNNISGSIFNLAKDNLNKIFDVLVLSEIKRINKTAEVFNKANDNFKQLKKDGVENDLAFKTAFNDLMPGFHYIKTGTGVSIGSGAYFYMIPALNDGKSLVRDPKTKSIPLVTENLNKAKQELKDIIHQEINDKLSYWNEIGVADNLNKGSLSERNNKISNLAMDFTINSMMSYANQYMVFSGDPAQFAKPPKGYDGKISSYIKLIKSSLSNMFKRLAKDIAPGAEGNFKKTDKEYKIAFIDEPVANSQLATKNGKFNKKSPYANIDLADAQEWTTLEEHLKVLLAYGRVTQEQHDDILEKSKTNDLTLQQIGIVMQPWKPVQVTASTHPQTGMLTHYYIKTSSFPLVPQLVKGFPELEKMMNFMVDNKIDRLVPKSAVKIGFHKSTKLFEGDKFVGDENFNTKNIVVLDRSGFRTQQDVPYSFTKKEILEGSQLRKGIFGNLDSSMTFGPDNKSAVELKNLSDKIHTHLYDKRFSELSKKLDVDKDGKIKDLSYLRDLMYEEARDRGYSDNDILLLNTMKLDNGRIVFNIPLFFHPNAHKIESLLNSVIKNKVLKNELPGKSYVQGSSLGFSVATEDFLKTYLPEDNGVILTKDYKGNLDYRREKDGSLYGEIFIPSHFKDADGNPLDLTKYIDSKGFLDTSKIDPEVLTMIGYRIPTQGFSSMIKLKVVGILPEIAGDLVIVPPAMVTQMGSDFDVDKLFIHKYNYESVNGKISKVQTSEDLDNSSDEQLQNKLIETYLSILSSKEVGNMAEAPLDNDIIKDLVEGPLAVQDEALRSPIMDSLHTDMIDVQSAGKIGVALTSIASTFHSLSQYAGLYIKPKYNRETEKTKYLNIAFDGKSDHSEKDLIETKLKDDKSIFQPKDNTSNLDVRYSNHSFKGAWRLDKINGFTGRLISDVLTNIQTEAVDNANNGRLFPMNLNRSTFNVATLIARSGHDEKTIGFFLNQPSIKEYIARLSSMRSYTDVDFVKDQKQTLKEDMLKEIGVTESYEDIDVQDISTNDMLSALNTTELNTDLQQKALINFMIYEEISEDLGRVQKSLNVDTRFLGRSFSSVVDRSNSFAPNVTKNLSIGNAFALYSIKDGFTTAGSAVNSGVFKAMNLFGEKNLLPYDSELFKNIFKDIAFITDKDLSEDNIEDIAIGIRSSVWQMAMNKVFDFGSPKTYRKDLIYGDNTLAHRIIQAKEDMPKNDFIQSLNPVVPFDKSEVATVSHYSAKNAKAEYDYRKQMGWLNLLNYPVGTKEHQLGMDLFVYSVTFGTERSAKDFGRYIPYDFLIQSGVAEELRGIFSSAESMSAISDNFIQQYFQHNPNKLKSLTADDIVSTIDGKIIPTFEILGFNFPYVKRFNSEIFKSEVYKLQDGQYVKMDSLGVNFMTEYDLDTDYATTVIKDNPKGSKDLSIVNAKKYLGRVETVNTGRKILEDYQFDSNFETVLGNIVKTNSEQSVLANHLFKHIDRLGGIKLEEYDYKNPAHTDNNINDIFIRGKYISGQDTILIHAPFISDADRFERTFVHESVHALTSKLINANESDLTEDQLKAKKSLETLFEKVKEKVPQRIQSNSTYSNGFKNLDEFAAESMTNKDFQQLLEDTKIQGGTFFSKFKQLILELFGITNKNSTLAKVMSNVLNVMEVSGSIESQKTTDQSLESRMSPEEIIETQEISKHCKKK